MQQEASGMPLNRKPRIQGLDSIRFICAVWVAMCHHLDPPILTLVPEGPLAGKLFHGVYNNILNGPAAVIVFFVISGFCIHYPFAGNNKSPHLLEFYTRRSLRILVPLLAILSVAMFTGTNLSHFNTGILWSLVCELIYYAIYPALLTLRLRHRSWLPALAVSFFASLWLASTNPGAGNYPSFGFGLNWLLGLPCWLLGCQLAEWVSRSDCAQREKIGNIWKWRLGVLFAAWVASAMRFHTPIGYPWTLNFFGILATCWLLQEIIHRETKAPSKRLETAGLASYTLYLIHVPAHDFVYNLSKAHFTDMNPWLYWILSMLVLFGSCILFYLIIEKPSHLLARHLGGQIRKRALNG